MAKKLYEEASVLAIANAIRAKNGSTATYKIAEMAGAVQALTGGGAGDTTAAEATTCVADQITAASFRLRTNGSSRCWANGSQIRWIALAM